MSAPLVAAAATAAATLGLGAAGGRYRPGRRALPRRDDADALPAAASGVEPHARPLPRRRFPPARAAGGDRAQGAGAGARRRPLIVVGSVVAALTVATVAGPVLAGTVATTAVGVRTLRRRRRVALVRRSVEAAMPDATELLVACLYAGRSPTQAIADLARLAPPAVRPAFAAVEQRLHRGHGLGDALGELTARCGTCALALVTAMSSAVRDGLPLAPVLDRLTDEANATRRRQGEAAARRLPVRLSFPLVACTLPSFVLLSVAPAILGALSSLRGAPL